jgi:beta-glucosidase
MGRIRLRPARGAAALLALAAVVAVPSTGIAGKSKQPQAGKPRMEHGCARIEDKLPTYADWPRVESRIKDDHKLEARVQRMLASLTLEEKVGQMTQPEISTITPAQVEEFHIGSVLNGGGAWPQANKHAAPGDWLALADA